MFPAVIKQEVNTKGEREKSEVWQCLVAQSLNYSQQIQLKSDNTLFRAVTVPENMTGWNLVLC